MITKRIKITLTAYLGLCWLAIIWLIAYFLQLKSGYVSDDEVFFATREVDGFFSNRALWLLINQFTGLFTDNIIETMRILNFGFVILIYLIAVRTLVTFHPLVLALALSYASCVAAFNFRDLAILLGVLVFLDGRSRFDQTLSGLVQLVRKHKALLLYLVMLRPLQAILLLASGLRWYLLMGGIVLTLAFLQTPLGSAYFYNYSYYTMNFTDEVSQKAESKGLVSTEPSLKNITLWTARFVFAPSPMSVANRVISDDDSYPYGKFDLSVRALSRLSIYLLFLSLGYYFLRAPKVVMNTLRKNSFVIKFGFMFSIVYALFNLGASHERIKMTILILALFVVDRVRSEYFKRVIN